VGLFFQPRSPHGALCRIVVGVASPVVILSQFLATDSLPDLTREYVYTLQSVHQLTATVWQIKQIRSQVLYFSPYLGFCLASLCLRGKCRLGRVSYTYRCL